VHSDFSHDGRDSLASLVQFGLDRGLDFIALSDHAEDLTAERFLEYRRQCEIVSVPMCRLIAGLEFRFAGYPGMHLMALGLRTWLEPSTPEQFVMHAPNACELTVVAHPKLCNYVLPAAVSETIDAIEVWNGTYNTRYLPDPRAIRMVHELRRRRPQVIATVGLDQHDRRNDRELRVEVEDRIPNVLEAIKRGRFTNRGRTLTLNPAAALGFGRLPLLTVARTALDTVDRVHERLHTMVRSIRAR
jgi:hypothetical protein